MTAPGVVSALIGTAAENKIRDLELRLNAVRQQRDEATQQLLDERATVSLLRRKLARQTALRYASRIGYCDSTFTPPDGGGTLTCALDAGHRANLHRDASLRYAWDDNAKPPAVERCDECETVGQNCRAHAVADSHGIEHNDMRDEGDARRELIDAAEQIMNIGVRPAPNEVDALVSATQRLKAAIEKSRESTA
ncbi:hypothetical protein KNV15_gp64 [Gordonia phage Jambalaya]|uniref:Uncharacterized protein n=1 Tax=Gordonia phage Jambalaya TaxID=2743985 RepID=A0A7D5G1I5_9CAUD|nr:hypothetical protein KNV15_gp64 [Gordonia phage Jambalaya]QLF84110.1 hypothetical protein SEA_JAMBALAYA_64 [Gordonia phage Jambalaya]WKW87190.1 hypothetical protein SAVBUCKETDAWG_64 [Gordonia phage Savbucketdawg]